MRVKLLLLAVLAALPSCRAMLNSLAENGEWGTMLKSAPVIPNPATRGVLDAVEVKDQSGTCTWRLVRFDPSGMCFSVHTPYEPQSLAATTYAAEAYVSVMDDRPGYGGSDAMHATSSPPRVVSSTSSVRKVEKYNSRLNAMEEKLETVYSTDAEVCFPSPRIPTATSKYLLVFPNVETGTGFAPYAAFRLE